MQVLMKMMRIRNIKMGFLVLNEFVVIIRLTVTSHRKHPVSDLGDTCSTKLRGRLPTVGSCKTS